MARVGTTSETTSGGEVDENSAVIFGRLVGLAAGPPGHVLEDGPVVRDETFHLLATVAAAEGDGRFALGVADDVPGTAG